MALAAVKQDDQDELEQCLRDPVWRLNNLYKIVDKDGQVVRFRMNGPQENLLKNLHYKNLILKARQLGFSTFVQILMLDTCLWVAGTHVGMVAHRLPDATRIFREKAQFAYDHLDDLIKERIPVERRSATEMVFANGSSFVVGVSLRSGTYQVLHISEHGKICAQWPEKAKEVKTGALPTVPANGFVFIESTAEGQYGDFFDFCQQARQDQRAGVHLTSEHYRFHFYAWFLADEYRLDPETAKGVEIPEKFVRYFQTLEKNHGIKLTLGQRAWYVLKARTQHEDMKREMPSTADEAFEAIVEHAIYGDQIAQALDDGRIGRFKAVPGVPCYTFWDIGISDHTAIWVVQFLPRNVRRMIGFYAGHNLATPHYTNWLQSFAARSGITYRGHILPHDGKNRDKLTGERYVDGVQRITGVKSREMKRSDVNLGIYEIRNIFPFFEIDEEGCEDGLRGLKSYQWDMDEKTDMARKQPKHDWSSHVADSLRTSAFFRPHMFRKVTQTDGAW